MVLQDVNIVFTLMLRKMSFMLELVQLVLPVGQHFEDLTMVRMTVLKTNEVYFLLAVDPFSVVVTALNKAFSEKLLNGMPGQPKSEHIAFYYKIFLKKF